MTAKNEAEFAQMCKRMNIWCHKWRDVTRCNKCGSLVYLTKRVDGEDEVAESIVDYLIFVGSVPAWVECKGNNNQMKLYFREINQKQSNFLSSWCSRGIPSWLFLTLGYGPAPAKRKTWLIPWVNWVDLQDWASNHRGQAGIEWLVDPDKIEAAEKKGLVTMDDFFPYQLDWMGSNIGWAIPADHLAARMYSDLFVLPPLFQKE